MQNFLTFIRAFLPILADFLSSEPMFTMCGCICFVIVIGAVAKLCYR